MFLLLFFASRFCLIFFLLHALITDTDIPSECYDTFLFTKKTAQSAFTLKISEVLLQIWFQFWLTDAFLSSYMAFILPLSKLSTASKKYLDLAKSNNPTYLAKHQSLFLKGKETLLIQIFLKWKWTLTRFRNMLFSQGSYVLPNRVRNDIFYCHFSLILPIFVYREKSISLILPR